MPSRTCAWDPWPDCAENPFSGRTTSSSWSSQVTTARRSARQPRTASLRHSARRRECHCSPRDIRRRAHRCTKPMITRSLSGCCARRQSMSHTLWTRAGSGHTLKIGRARRRWRSCRPRFSPTSNRRSDCAGQPRRLGHSQRQPRRRWRTASCAESSQACRRSMPAAAAPATATAAGAAATATETAADGGAHARSSTMWRATPTQLCSSGSAHMPRMDGRRPTATGAALLAV